MAAIDDETVAPLLREWSASCINAFCDAAITQLAAFSGTSNVLDAGRASGTPGLSRRDGKVPLDAIQRSGPLATFVHIDLHGWELVHYALHSAAGNLVDIIVTICPSCFATLVERVEHPVIQARANDALRLASGEGAKSALSRITPSAGDPLIAISIIRVLHGINDLQENQGDPTNADEVDSLIGRLVDRIGCLSVDRVARWFGDLLTHAPHVLHRAPDHGCPPNVQRLEDASLGRMAELVAHSTSRDFVSGFRDSLASESAVVAVRHLAGLAWALHEDSPEQAAIVARRALDDFRQHVDDGVEIERFYFSWESWRDRETVFSLGRALALTIAPAEFQGWIEMHCRRLPLSVWDAEERFGAFLAGDRVAQYLFLVALHALYPAMEIGHVPRPQTVRALAETIWGHCRFAEDAGCWDAATTPAAEGAVRVALQLGELDDRWILRQVALNPGPRALLALAKGYVAPSNEASHQSNAFMVAFTDACTALLDGAPTPDLAELAYWGELWLALAAPGPAERTGATILKHLRLVGGADRTSKILALKLLTLAGSVRKLAPEVEKEAVACYDALWSTQTFPHERADREEVDRYRTMSLQHPDLG